MDAAGVLPAFGGITCHDAWTPYDCYDGVAGHALSNAHVLRELTAVTETGTNSDVTWAGQAIDALLALKKAADAARTEGEAPPTQAITGTYLVTPSFGSNRPFSVPCAAMRKAPDGTAASREAGVHPVPSRGLAGVAVDG